MSHNILLTGASGYLGGTILAKWKTAALPSHAILYALVRNEDQSAQVQKYGATPLVLNISEHDALVSVNPTIIDTADAHGVRSYIFAPCLVYGPGEGFRNKTSIQDVAIVKAAMKVRRVYKVDTDNPTWPVCHIADTAGLYLQVLEKILQGEEIGYGKNGYYLAASGHVHWNDVYKAMAKALAKRNVIDDDDVMQADDEVLKKMGEALEVTSMVSVLLGGMYVICMLFMLNDDDAIARCRFTPEHGRQIGWSPEYPPSHILEEADAEVELILGNMDGKKPSIR